MQLLSNLDKKGIKAALLSDGKIKLSPKSKITDELIQFVRENKRQLIHELKKEKAQAIRQLENSLTNQIATGKYLRVEFDGFNRLVAVCRPEDEGQLKNDGLLTLTTKELAMLEYSNTDKDTLLNLLKIKQAFTGAITGVERL